MLNSETKKKAIVQKLPEKDLIVIYDNNDNNLQSSKNENKIYFHGHTLGLAESVFISDEEIKQINTWIELLDNEDKELNSELNSLIKYLKQYNYERIAQVQRLINSSSKISTKENNPELEKLLLDKQKIDKSADREFLSSYLKNIKKQKIKQTHQLKNKEKKNKEIFALQNGSISSYKVQITLSELKPILYDFRFRDAVFLPIQVGAGETVIRLNAGTSSTKGFSNLIENPPQRYVMANCLFGGNLQGKIESDKIQDKTGSEEMYSLITHNLQVDLSKGAINSLQHIKKWSPYEMTMFVQFEKQLEFIKAISGHLTPIVHYHLPADSYVLTALEQVFTGKLSLDALEPYFDAVSERAAAHKHVIQGIAKEPDVTVQIESPFDNLDDIKTFIEDNFGKTVFIKNRESKELKFVNLILQALRDNEYNITHRNAWRKVLPDNISEARNFKEWQGKLPKTINALLHLANAMMIAIANEANNGDKKQNFKVCPFHSWDEKPIPDYYAKNLSEKFGACVVLDVFPEVLYYGDKQGNNLFRVTPETSECIYEDLKQKIIEHYQPSQFLETILEQDNIDCRDDINCQTDQQNVQLLLFPEQKKDVNIKNEKLQSSPESPKVRFETINKEAYTFLFFSLNNHHAEENIAQELRNKSKDELIKLLLENYKLSSEKKTPEDRSLTKKNLKINHSSFPSFSALGDK